MPSIIKLPPPNLPNLLGSKGTRCLASSKQSTNSSAEGHAQKSKSDHKQDKHCTNLSFQSKVQCADIALKRKPMPRDEVGIVPCPTNLALPSLTAQYVSWNSEEWLRFEREVMSSCSWKSIRKLVECIHRNSVDALQRGRYKTENKVLVDLSKYLRPSACTYWFGRDNVVVPNELCFLGAVQGGAQSGMMSPPPFIVMTASPLEAVTRLASSGIGEDRSIDVVIEVSHFQQDGRVITYPMPGMSCTQQEALLCTDFPKFAAAAASGYLRKATCTPQSHLTAPEDPYVFLCQDMTVFRGPRAEGYPLLAKPVRINGICTGSSTTRPTISMGCAAENMAARKTEWYSCEDDQLALLERLNLIGLTALQHHQEENSTPKILVLSMLGYCGHGSRHPRDAVANSLKQWRFRFARLFHAIILACGPDEELAKLFDLIINEDVYEADRKGNISNFDSWHWDDRFWPMHVNGIDFMLVAAACQASKAKRMSNEPGASRKSTLASKSRRQSIQSLPERSETSISFSPEAKDSRRNSLDSGGRNSNYRRTSIDSSARSSAASGMGNLSSFGFKCQRLVGKGDDGMFLWQKPLPSGRGGAMSTSRLIDAKHSSFIATCQGAMNMRQAELGKVCGKSWFQGRESRRVSIMASRRSSVMSSIFQSRRPSIRRQTSQPDQDSRHSSCTVSTQQSRRTSCVIKESSEKLEELVSELGQSVATKLQKHKSSISAHRVETALTGEASQDEWTLRDECTILAARLQEHWLNSAGKNDRCHIGLSPFYLAWRFETGQIEGQAFANLGVAQKAFTSKQNCGYETMLFTDDFEEVCSSEGCSEHLSEFEAWWKLQTGFVEDISSASESDSEGGPKDMPTIDEVLPSSPAWQKGTVKQAFLKLRAMAFMKVSTCRNSPELDTGRQKPKSPSQEACNPHVSGSNSEIPKSCTHPADAEQIPMASYRQPTIDTDLIERGLDNNDDMQVSPRLKKSPEATRHESNPQVSPQRRMPTRVRRSVTQMMSDTWPRKSPVQSGLDEIFKDIEDIRL